MGPRGLSKLKDHGKKSNIRRHSSYGVSGSFRCDNPAVPGSFLIIGDVRSISPVGDLDGLYGHTLRAI